MRIRIVLLAVMGAVAPLWAGPVAWKGITWTPEVGAIALTGLNLAVTAVVPDPSIPGQSYWGLAHYNTPQPFRDAAIQRIDVAFIDSGADPFPQVWVVEEGITSDITAQIGAKSGYFTFVFRPGQEEYVTLSQPRTAGPHTVSAVKAADDTVSLDFDGSLVHTSAIPMRYFGDVYLGAGTFNGTGTVLFTDYAATATETPEPATALLACAALVALLALRPRIPH